MMLQPSTNQQSLYQALITHLWGVNSLIHPSFCPLTGTFLRRAQEQVNNGQWRAEEVCVALLEFIVAAKHQLEGGAPLVKPPDDFPGTLVYQALVEASARRTLQKMVWGACILAVCTEMSGVEDSAFTDSIEPWENLKQMLAIKRKLSLENLGGFLNGYLTSSSDLSLLN